MFSLINSKILDNVITDSKNDIGFFDISTYLNFRMFKCSNCISLNFYVKIDFKRCFYAYFYGIAYDVTSDN
jgi:hypothetical protein